MAKLWNECESNGKREDNTAACEAMFYWSDKARGRTEQEARSRGITRGETFTFFIFLPPTALFFFALVSNTFPRLMCSCKETTVLRAKNTGVTRNV